MLSRENYSELLIGLLRKLFIDGQNLNSATKLIVSNLKLKPTIRNDEQTKYETNHSNEIIMGSINQVFCYVKS